MGATLLQAGQQWLQEASPCQTDWPLLLQAASVLVLVQKLVQFLPWLHPLQQLQVVEGLTTCMLRETKDKVQV